MEKDNVLDRIRTRAGGPGSKAYIAAVGKWFAEFGVHPRERPRPLGRFLASLTGFCQVLGEFVIFADGAAPELPVRVSQFVRSDSGHGQRSSPHRLLNHEFWNAMITNRAGFKWYLDLETLAIIEVAHAGGAVDPPVVDEPERYLMIPTIATSDQQEHARSILKPLLGVEAAIELTSGKPWWPSFLQKSDESNREAVLEARGQWISKISHQWMQSQGLPVQRFLAPSRRRAPETMELRRRLHRAVDEMTDEELLHLRVPARFLTKDWTVQPRDEPADSGSE